MGRSGLYYAPEADSVDDLALVLIVDTSQGCRQGLARARRSAPSLGWARRRGVVRPLVGNRGVKTAKAKLG